jgi:beta-aspartyl-peptidase (threonine type)
MGQDLSKRSTVSSAKVFTETKMKGQAVLVIHGGAGKITRDRYPPNLQEKYRVALKSALEAGHTVLSSGGCSLDAVEAAINSMENNPLFNAGKGAVLTRDGKVELEASVMVSSPAAAGSADIDVSRRTTAVTMLSRVKNPITLAKRLYLAPEKTRHVIHAAPYAETVAEGLGCSMVEESYFHTPARDHQFTAGGDADYAGIGDAKGTVGAVALDINGNLAVGTSTGGVGGKLPGRIGDTPIAGAGYWCEEFTVKKSLFQRMLPWRSTSAKKGMAVSGTGDGDYFLRYAVCHDMFERMKVGGQTLERAASDVLKEMGRAGGDGGAIGVTHDGQVVMEMNCEGMFRGWIDLNEGKPRVGVFLDELVQ